jgi:rifampicin phosphotransferase
MTMTSIEWVRSLPDVGVKDTSLGENRRRRLHGKPASPGRYTGTVRVIHSEAEFDRLRAGDVLVCPVVLPVWTVLFPHVGALVTDSGGILSNPAIVARECGVPSVVATRMGTTVLRDGQLVIVDGTRGTVEILG